MPLSSLVDVGSIDQSAFAALMLSPQRSMSNGASPHLLPAPSLADPGALSALLWDILITMGDEVNYIWLTRWTPLKTLYFFTRYYSIIILIVLNTQQITATTWVIMESISAVLLEVTTEVILILRIRAMYAASRRFTLMLFLLWILQTIVMVVSVGTSIPKILKSPDKLAPVVPVQMIAYSIASIVYETLLFALVIYKLVLSRHESRSHSPPSFPSNASSRTSATLNASKRNTSLLDILIRDSVWAYAAIFVVMVVNTVLFGLFSRTLGAFGFPWILAILGSVGPRLILN
ncbi:hypothetical protein EIP91_010022, partial [Steccherinum ochraceum]